MYSFDKHQRTLFYRFIRQRVVAVKATNVLARRIASVLICIVLASVSTVALGHKQYPEEKIKAAFLYNFLRFVSWPDEPLDGYRICTYGLPAQNEAAFGSIAEIKTDPRLIVSFVQTNDSLERLDNCQLIYIATKNQDQVTAVLKRMQGKGCLTIGEANDFLDMGGMIRFVPIEDKIRFEINVDAAKRAGLKISSNVLKIAVRLVAGK